MVRSNQLLLWLQTPLMVSYHIYLSVMLPLGTKGNITTKLAHGLHHGTTVVEYNVILKFLIIGDVKYPAHARLQKIETHSTPVM